jgi:signal transduction histidine kinase
MNNVKNKLESVLSKFIYPNGVAKLPNVLTNRVENFGILEDDMSFQNVKKNDTIIDLNIYLKMFIHEVRTPLSTISMGMNILETENTANYKIIRDIKNSIDFIEEIFTKFAVIQDGNIQLNAFESFSIKDMFARVQTLLQYIVDEANLSIEYNIDPSIHDLVYGDKYNINHCIINLLKNSVKYRNTQHKTIITINVAKIAAIVPAPPPKERRPTRLSFLQKDRTIMQKPQKQTIVITIRDNNDHILPHIKEHLFESFNSTSGSGLGLYICKNIVELHGGTIVHHFVQPLGNEFTITLTFQTCENPIISTDNINSSVSEKSDNENLINILLVDDSLLNRNMMCKIMRSTGLFRRIYTASNGQEAITKMENPDHNIKIVFLDKRMPIMDGIQTAMGLRIMGYNHLIFGLTGDVDQSDDFWNSGADYVIAKPLDKIKITMIIDFITKHGVCCQENKTIQNKNGVLEWV